jgi:cholera toxin transcriptional activator
MTDMSAPGQMDRLGPNEIFYLEKDIFFDLRSKQLVGATSSVALNFRESALLQLLLAGRARKQAVIEAAWTDNGTIVTEASYHQLVRSLRKKFEEMGLPPQSIKTLPRFGLEYLREQVNPEADLAMPPVAADAIAPAATAAVPPRFTMRWAFSLLAPPLLAALSIGLAAHRCEQPPMEPVANDFGVHLFEIGGVQFDAKLLAEVERRANGGEYVYMARNGPKVWLGMCPTAVQKEFSFCRQDYFSLY